MSKIVDSLLILGVLEIMKKINVVLLFIAVVSLVCISLVGCGEGAHTCTWEQPEIIPATCVSDAIKSFKCKSIGCNETKTEPVADSALGHDWERNDITPATCGADEVEHYGCTRCAGTKDETIAETATLLHDWFLKDARHATCINNRVEYFECNVCRTSKSDEIPNTATGECTWRLLDDVTPATCARSEIKYYECEVCGDIVDTPQPGTALGHDFEVPATCTQPQQCIRCDYVVTVTEETCQCKTCTAARLSSAGFNGVYDDSTWIGDGTFPEHAICGADSIPPQITVILQIANSTEVTIIASCPAWSNPANVTAEITDIVGGVLVLGKATSENESFANSFNDGFFTLKLVSEGTIEIVLDIFCNNCNIKDPVIVTFTWVR